MKNMILILVVMIIATGMWVTGGWRKCLTDRYVWTLIEDGEAYAVYLDAVEKEFGSREVAKDTYKEWVVQHWKGNNTMFTKELHFMINGTVFVIKRVQNEWVLEGILSKEVNFEG